MQLRNTDLSLLNSEKIKALIKAYGSRRVSKMLNVSRATLYRMLKRGALHDMKRDLAKKLQSDSEKGKNAVILIELLSTLWKLGFDVGYLKNLHIATVRQISAVFYKANKLLGLEYTIMCWVFFRNFCYRWAVTPKDPETVGRFLARVKEILVRAKVLTTSAILIDAKLESVMQTSSMLLLFQDTLMSTLEELLGQNTVSKLLDIIKRGSENVVGIRN